MKVINEIRKTDDIEEFLNEVSRKYVNFTNYIITPHDILSDTYNVKLCFDELKNTTENKEEIIQVYLMKNIFKDNINELIEAAYADFENLIDIDVLPNLDKKHLSHVVLKYKIKINGSKFIPVDITAKSWSGGSNLGGCEYSLEICKYKNGESFAFSDNSLYKEICITEINKGMLIRAENNPSYYEMLFKIKYDEKINKYKLIEYDNLDERVWSEKRKIVRECELDSINISQLREEIIKKIEKDLEIYVSKRSYGVFDEKIEYMASVSGIEFNKN